MSNLSLKNLCLERQLNIPIKKEWRYRNEIDRFGFSSILYSLLLPPYKVRGFCHWQHGWHFAWRDMHFDEVGKACKENLYGKRLPCIVYNNRLRELFLSNNFSDVRLGPLPFALYNQYFGSDKLLLNRPIDYLVLLPKLTSSSVENIPISNELACVEVISFIEEVIKHVLPNKNITLLLYHKDIEIPVISDYIIKNKLNWISGASPNDTNSLSRIHKIFSLSKVVYSNVLGSAIPYAALCGAKVGISQTSFYELQNPQFKNITRPKWDKYHNIKYLSKYYPNILCNNIKECTYQKRWAIKELSANIKLNEKELKEILGWSFPKIIYRQFMSILTRGVNKIKN